MKQFLIKRYKSHLIAIGVWFIFCAFILFLSGMNLKHIASTIFNLFFMDAFMVLFLLGLVGRAFMFSESEANRVLKAGTESLIVANFFLVFPLL